VITPEHLQYLGARVAESGAQASTDDSTGTATSQQQSANGVDPLQQTQPSGRSANVVHLWQSEQCDHERVKTQQALKIQEPEQRSKDLGVKQSEIQHERARLIEDQEALKKQRTLYDQERDRRNKEIDKKRSEIQHERAKLIEDQEVLKQQRTHHDQEQDRRNKKHQTYQCQIHDLYKQNRNQLL
jgi:hypothetical protein